MKLIRTTLLFYLFLLSISMTVGAQETTADYYAQMLKKKLLCSDLKGTFVMILDGSITRARFSDTLVGVESSDVVFAPNGLNSFVAQVIPNESAEFKYYYLYYDQYRSRFYYTGQPTEWEASSSQDAQFEKWRVRVMEHVKMPLNVQMTGVSAGFTCKYTWDL